MHQKGGRPAREWRVSTLQARRPEIFVSTRDFGEAKESEESEELANASPVSVPCKSPPSSCPSASVSEISVTACQPTDACTTSFRGECGLTTTIAASIPSTVRFKTSRAAS